MERSGRGPDHGPWISLLGRSGSFDCKHSGLRRAAGDWRGIGCNHMRSQLSGYGQFHSHRSCRGRPWTHARPDVLDARLYADRLQCRLHGASGHERRDSRGNAVDPNDRHMSSRCQHRGHGAQRHGRRDHLPSGDDRSVSIWRHRNHQQDRWPFLRRHRRIWSGLSFSRRAIRELCRRQRECASGRPRARSVAEPGQREFHRLYHRRRLSTCSDRDGDERLCDKRRELQRDDRLCDLHDLDQSRLYSRLRVHR